MGLEVFVRCSTVWCFLSDGKPSCSAAMSDSLDRTTKISLLKEPLLKKLCEVLDRSGTGRGWRRLGEIVGGDRRVKVR